MNLSPQAALRVARKLSAQAAKRLKQTRLNLVLDRDYWKGLNPGLHISTELRYPPEETQLSSERQDVLLRSLKEHGYFRGDAILPLELVEKVRGCIEALQREEWPAAFAFVYDEAWALTRGPSLVRLLSLALGPGYTQAPDLWAHYVRTGAAGWRPHVDGYNGPDRLSIWVPLSEATLDNGCMFLIPKNRVPPRVARDYHGVTRFQHDEVDALLQNARPLPAPAGAFLCWESGIIHWGSQSQAGASPRISLAVELLREGFRTPDPTLPSLDGQKLPDFRDRLRAVAKGILSYYRFDPSALPYTDIAKSLLKQR